MKDIKNKTQETINLTTNKLSNLLHKAIQGASIVILSVLAFKGAETLWIGKPDISNYFGWLVISLLLYAHYK